MKAPPPLPRPAASKVNLWPALARVLMLVIGAGSVVLVWWSVNRLPSLSRQVREKDSARANFAAEVQQLEMDWNADAARALETQYETALERLFEGTEEPQQWRAAFTSQGKELAFDTELQLGVSAPQAAPEHKLLVTPATLRLQPAAEGKGLTNSPYERLLALAATLSNSKRRVDVIELSVVSDSNSVAQARAELQLWSREKVNP